MHIEVQKRLKPFDHVPGRFLPLPGSCFSLQVFPALISIYDLRNSEKKCISEIKTSIKGPIKCFTVELDLEKGSILVFGESLEGYFRYRISKCLNEDSLIFEVEKTKGFLLAFQETFGDLKVFKENETEFLISKNKQKLDVFKPSSHEKLFLGINKALDINKILSRCDFIAFFFITAICFFIFFRNISAFFYFIVFWNVAHTFLCARHLFFYAFPIFIVAWLLMAH